MNKIADQSPSIICLNRRLSFLPGNALTLTLSRRERELGVESLRYGPVNSDGVREPAGGCHGGVVVVGAAHDADDGPQALA